jgi:AraC family transcriptional regulator of adaptative response/methylated-DNA-[protein]-cysteine methyltransferase
MKATLQTCVVPTRDGTFLAYYSEQGLARLEFPNGKTPKTAELTSPKMKRWHKITARAIEEVMAGKPVTELPPLDLSAGTDFQRKVWNALRKISCGKTKSYSEIAAAVGKPKGARATGGACGANPIPLFIPCHRVLASGGKLGGFSSGLDWKRKLLERENVTHYRE